MTTLDSGSLTNNNIALATGNRKKPLKKLHCISNRYVVVIDESIVQKLEISEDTWFEEEHTEDGILLKIRPL
jgi:hypothetical protein